MVIRIENLLKDVDASNAVWASNLDNEGRLQYWTSDVHFLKGAVRRGRQVTLRIGKILKVSVHVRFHGRWVILRIEPNIKVYKRITPSPRARARGKGPVKGYGLFFLNNWLQLCQIMQHR